MSDTESDNSGSLNHSDIQALTADITAAYLSHNNLPVSEVGNLISTVYEALKNTGASSAPNRTELKPAVAVNKSIHPDYLICLEDGKKLKMLRRHLKTSYNLTAEQYREKWGLSHDYPMVAPNYTLQRSSLAKQIGLGTSRRNAEKQSAA